jgi:type IV pilus assembly protein PilF
MKQYLIWIILLGFLLPACTSSTRLPRKESGLAEAVKIQGEALLLQGDYTAALSKLLDARKMTPDDPYLLNSLGLAYMGKKRDDLAEPLFLTALTVKPDYTEALNNLGVAYLRQKKWNLAIPAFEKVLQDLLYPTPQFPLSNLGRVYLEKQNYQLAESYFLQALDVMPGFVTASHGLAQVYLASRQVDEAIDFLTNALRRLPNTAILHADLAQAYEAKGWTNEARQSWQNVLNYAKKNSGLKKIATKRLSALN